MSSEAPVEICRRHSRMMHAILWRAQQDKVSATTKLEYYVQTSAYHHWVDKAEVHLNIMISSALTLPKKC